MISSFYFDRVLFFIFLILITIGTIFIYSAISTKALYTSSYTVFIKKEVIIFIIGLVALISGYLIPIDFWKKHGYKLAILAIVLLIAVLIFPAETKKGVKRWLNLGLMRFQPSEFAKFAVVVFIATYLYNKKKDKNLPDLYKVLGVFSIPAVITALVLIEPHKGAAMFIFGLSFILAASSYLPFRYTFLPAIVAIPVFSVFIYFSNYARERIQAFIDPMHAKSTQVLQALLAFAKGGLFGEGIGAGLQKLMYLPEIHTDYIFALIGEELGFVGAATVVILFMLLLWRGLKISLDRQDLFTQILGVGLTFMITLQAAFHMLVNVGAFPPTGFTLPFISYGGSSFLIDMLAAGILLRISKEPVKSPFVEDDVV